MFNSKGMYAKCSYMIWTQEKEYIAFDMIGVDVAVKAIWSTIHNNSGNGTLTLKRDRNDRIHKYVDPKVSYVREKELLFQDPPLYRWHIRPKITKDCDHRFIYGFDKNIETIEQQFYLAMQQSIFPIQRNWVEKLMQKGNEMGVISTLEHTHSVSAAFMINMNMWKDIIHKMIIDREIQVEEVA